MKKPLANRLISLVMCLCLLMSTTSFDMLAAIAESPETVTTPTDVEEPSGEPAEPTDEPEPAAEPTEGPEELPGEVLAVQAMIDALPTAAELAAMDVDAQRAAYAQTQAAYEAYQGLMEERQALITGADVFEALFAFFNGQIMTLAAVTLDVSNGSITITDEGYRIGSGAVTPHTGDYIITGSSGSNTITVNVTGTVAITFRGLSLTGHNKTILQIQSGVVYVTLEGNNTLQCHQDFQSASAVTMGSGAELHFKGSGSITIHGSSNYWGGGNAITGGKVYVEGGTVTLVGGNKIEGSYGKCFDGESITVDGGNLNYYQGMITSKNRGVISANEAVCKKGKVNGNTLTAAEVPVPEAESIICTGVTLKTVSYVKYRMDSGAWQESPVFTGLAEGSTHTFYQARLSEEDPYFLSNSVTSATFTLTSHQWSEPVFDGMNKGTHTKTCPVCNLEQRGTCSGGAASYFQEAVCAVCGGIYQSYLTDTTAPTGSLRIGLNVWTTLLDTITFELFYPDEQTVTIQATDDSSDHDGYTDANAVKVAYYIHDEDAALTRRELDERAFAEYADAVSLTEDGKYTVYARLTDWADNVTYLSSNGIVVDQTPPVIHGVEDGKTYQISVSFTVAETNLKEVTVNGEVVRPDAGGNYTLGLGPKTIVVTDKAGHSVTCRVTVERKDISETTVTLTPESVVFNGSAQRPAVTVTDGDATLRAGTDYTTDYTNNINAGTAAVTITGIGNYEGSVTVNFAIIPAAPVVTAPEPKIGLVYDGTAQQLITAGSTSGGTMVYSLTESGEYTEAIPVGTDAGEYQVWYKVVGNENYEGTAADRVTVTIDRATLTADMFTFMPAADLIYDGRAKAATVTSTVAGVGSVTVKYVGDNELLTGVPTEVGRYTVRIDVAESTNYNAAVDLIAADWAFDVRFLTAPSPAYTLAGEQYRDGDVLWVDETHQVSIVPPTGYTISATLGSGYADSLPVTAWTAGDPIYLRDAMGHMTDAVAVTESVRVDNAAPMGQIALENIGSWQMLLANPTYGLFFKEAKTVSIEASDDESGVAGVSWLLVTDALPDVTPEWLGSQNWQALTGETITLPKDGQYAVFAKVTDNVGHVTYISTDGIVIYTDAEALTETVTYTKTGTADVPAQVTLNGNTIAAVTLNGSALEPGVDYTVDGGTINFKAGWLDTLLEGQYTLAVSYDPQGVAYQPGGSNDEPAATQITLTVGKAEPAIIRPEPKIGLVYDGTAQQLITAGSTNGGTMVYSRTENGAYAETIPTGTDAGDYQVWYKVVGNDSYEGTAAQFVEVTIGKAEQAALTIANGPDSVTYGDDPFTLLTSGGSGEGAVTWAVTEGAAYASVDADGQVTVIGAGEVVITATKAADGNHKADVTAAYAFTVNRRTLTASISGDTTKVYDGGTAAPEGLRIVLTNVVFGDAVTASAQEYAYDAAQAGQRVIIATGIALDNGEKAANYVLTADTATLDGEITAKTIDLGAQTFIYDGGDTFTVDADGVTLADGTVETVTVTLTTAGKDAGDYDAADVTAEWDNDNYTIIIDKVTVGPLTAELVWSDELTFIYDGEPHGVTATVGNRQGDDAFALTYENNEATDAGEYTAVVTDLGNGNYALPENVGQAWAIIRATQDEPAVKIDFFAETLVPDGVVEYSLNGEDWLPCDPNMPVTATGWDGTEPVVICVRYAGDDNREAGAAIELTIPARPDAPEADIELVKSKTKITVQASDTLTGCEYAIDGEDWQPTGVFDGLAAGTEYTIACRTAATETSFASFSSEISVTTVSDDGTTTLQPGETVEAGGNTITNDGDKIIITDEEGNETTITPAEGTTVGEDGTITVPENGTVQTGGGLETTLPKGGTVGKDGTVTADEVIVDDTTVRGKDVQVASDGTITVPGGAVIEDERFGAFTAPEGGGTFDPETGVFTSAKGAGKVSAKAQAGADTPTIRIDMSGEALRDAVLDAEGERLVAWGWDAEILLRVENIDAAIDGRTLDLVEEAAGAYAIGEHLEIILSRTIAGETEAIHEISSPVRLVIGVPQPFENDEERSYAVVRVHDGKAALLADEDSVADEITISTDRFSTYSIVYRASATPTAGPTAEPTAEPTATPAPTTVPDSDPPRTGDDSMLWLWLALLLVSGAGVAVTVLRRKSRKK